MTRILQALLYRPVALSMAGALVLGLSIFFGIKLPISTSPEAEFPRISIRATWRNASPEQMVAQVTAKIEEVAAAIRGVKKVTSRTREGLSLVYLEFEKDADANLIKVELMERLEELWQALPAGVSRPTLEKYVPKEFRDLQGFLVYQFFPKSDIEISPALIKEQLEKYLVPLLNGLEGIGEIVIYGAETERLIIELDETAMRALGVSIEDIQATLSQVSLRKSFGKVIHNQRYVSLRAETSIRSLTELEQIVIKPAVLGGTSTPMRFIKLRDVAKVRIEMPEQMRYFRINAKDAVTMAISREANSNSLKLADAVEATIQNVIAHDLSALTYVKAIDRTEPLRRELDNLVKDLAIALIAVLLVLFFFLRNARLTLIVILNIAFALSASVLALSALGYSLNLITIAGMILVFGILTDNAVVVMDNIERRLWMNKAKDELIAAATAEVFLPVLASTLTTIGALLPILFLPDEIRLYFIEFVVSISVSLLASLVISFTLIPSLVFHLGAKNVKIKTSSKVETWLSDVYRATLNYVLDRPKRFIMLAILLIGIPIYLLPDKLGDEKTPERTVLENIYNATLGSEYFLLAKPYLNYILGGSSYLFYKYVPRSEFFGYVGDTYLGISINAPQGTSPERLNEIASRFEKPLLEYQQGIEKFVTEINGEDAEITVYFSKDAPIGLPYIVKAHLTAIGARVGGALIAVYGYGPGFFSGSSEFSSFRLKALGYNYEKLKTLCEKLKEELEKNPRVDNCRIDKAFGYLESGSEIVLNLRRNALRNYDISLPNVLSTIQRKASGTMSLMQLVVDSREYQAEIKFREAAQYSTSDLSFDTYHEKLASVRLSDLVRIEQQKILSEILRENQQYQRWITLNYKGRYDFGQRYIENVLSQFPLPPGYSIDAKQADFFSFSAQNIGDFISAALLSLLIVFIVTAALYESFSKPFLIILAVPMALAGVFLSFYFFDANFGRGGYASLLLLSGIVVNNSIILVDRMMAKTQSQKTSSIKTAAIEASLERVRPILMTSLLTVASLLPMLIRAEKSSIWYGLTVGTIGGMISSTILVLLILPAIFLISERRHKLH
ncbi:MAG: efflux RND transporter permease subunit [Chloroherpetonaceae bacterium]|nr:efflux RND transporter permease subunit [Chloroherpetonaceae bacterium]